MHCKHSAIFAVLLYPASCRICIIIYIYILFRLVSARHIYPSVTRLSSHSLAVPRIASRDDYVLFHSKTISNQTRTPSLHLSYVPPFRFNVDIYPPASPANLVQDRLIFMPTLNKMGWPSSHKSTRRNSDDHSPHNQLSWVVLIVGVRPCNSRWSW